MNSTFYQQKTVLLTGATGDLGRALARGLGERGATLILSARCEEKLAELLEGPELAEPHGVAQVDVRSGGIESHLDHQGLPLGPRMLELRDEVMTLFLAGHETSDTDAALAETKVRGRHTVWWLLSIVLVSSASASTNSAAGRGTCCFLILGAGATWLPVL